MHQTSSEYKNEIKQPSRAFECRVTIGKNVYTNKDIVDIILDYPQAQDGFCIGNTISQSLDLTLFNTGEEIYSTNQIKVEIGLRISETIEYILLGYYNVDEVSKNDYTIKFTAFDNMMKFETPYFSNLGDRPILQQVINELASITGVSFTGNVPDYTVTKLEGYTCREVLSYVASLCGGNALITRDGRFTIKKLQNVDYSITTDNHFGITTEEVAYKVGKITCVIDSEKELSKGGLGTDSMELGFENPWMTESILNTLYQQLNGFSYLGFQTKWQGDLSLDPYDSILIQDRKGTSHRVPILSQKFTYVGGLTSELGAKGESKNKNSFSSSGSNSNKVNRLVTEQAIIKEALINKANIQDLEAVSIRTQRLEVTTAKIETAIIDVAYVSDLNVIRANISELKAMDATISQAVINKADISELNAAVANINILNADLGVIKNLVNGNLSSENIQTGGITSDKLTIANGFIKDAMIDSLNANKIKVGQINTALVQVASSSGNLIINDNTIQIRDANRLRVQIGKDASNDYSMSVWDSSGKLMFDARGLKADAIKDSIIRNDMISTNANIDGSKLNISSVVSEINEGSTTLKASKVQFDGIAQTLEVAFNLLKTQADGTKSQTESNTTAINIAQGKINTLIQDTTITKDGQTVKLKDEYSKLEQTVGSLSSTIGKQQTTIDDHTGKMTAFNSEMVSLKQNLNGLSASVSTAETTIQSHAQQLAQKADLSTVNDKINSIQVGGRNILRGTRFTDTVWWYIPAKCSFINAEADKPNNKILHFNNADTSSQWNALFQKPNVLINAKDIYTFSCEIYTVEKMDDVYFRLRYFDSTQPTTMTASANEIGNSDLTINNQMVVGKWAKISHTFTVPTLTDIKHMAVGIQLKSTANFKVRCMQLEKGNKSTDYTESPEDITSYIETKANSSDVYVKTEVYTKAQTDAAIKIAKDEINLGVSSTYETKTNVETKVNGAITTASNDATSKANEALISAKGYTDLQMTTVNQTITAKVAEIKLTTDSITQRVSTTESNLTNMTNKLNNLQIGVRNLVENSKIDQTSNAYGFGTRAVISGLKNNTTYTFTVNGRVNPEGNTEGKYLRCYIYEKTWKYGSWNLAITETSDTTKSLTFTTGSNLEGQTIEVNFYYYPSGGDRTGSATVNWCTLVEGNKGTIDWIEAPEDVQETIISTKTEVREYTDSQINIAKNVITQSVASTYETKTDATSKINGVNSSISALQQRVSTAESKITDTAITNLVKQNFYTKEETETQITGKGYATSSEVQQTSTSLIAKFSASGGYNAIRNSGFLHAFTFWGTQTHNSPTGGSIGTIGPTADWGFPNTRLNTAQIRLSNQSNVEYGLKCSVDTTIGKVYTIRFRYAAHRVNQVNVIVRNGGGGWHTNKYIDAPYTYSGGKGSEAGWGIFTHTFRANNTSHVLNFVITNAANDGFFWVAEPMVFEGDIDAPYSPHPSEVYWGQTLIDQNGIRVNASNVGTYTEMHAGGFFVKKNDGNLLFEATNKIALYDGKGISCISIVNDPSANYGNARIDLRGGINFIHNPGQDVGINQILLGNDDRSDKYGFHNMSIRCWNSFGFQDNYGYTNMFADVRRGRWIMKGALYQNTQTPPATFSMNFDGEDEIYNSGYERSQAIDSVMNLKTGVYVDNDGECCSAIYGGYSELITTEYQDEYGEITTHLNHEALNASLVVTCQEQQKLIKALQKELNEIKEYLNVA
ncbi:hypothetical protein PNU83_10725 [Turicibacter sanguinis]|uniref:hypothetical protein n=1 Tax=Turicibacter sanguinis TaxID=154288 RepID=UPI0018AC5A52|nr:hypothetical protein [Turicibacter sanguinis]MDB8564595.1 hypothetical protein [Turicibacter sanguinis]